jgi:hypothetical protein
MPLASLIQAKPSIAAAYVALIAAQLVTKESSDSEILQVLADSLAAHFDHDFPDQVFNREDQRQLLLHLLNSI